MRKIINGVLVVLMMCMLLAFVACESAPASKVAGEWTGKDTDGSTVTWTFNADNTLSTEHQYFGDKEGTYTLNIANETETTADGTIAIMLDGWDEEKVYDLDVTETSLTLLIDDGMSPEYWFEK